MTESATDTGGSNISRLPPRHLALAAAIALAVVALYWPTHAFQFLNFDDNVYVTENAFVRDGLSRANVAAAFTHPRGGHYHPLTWLSHMVDVSLFGLRPGPAHLVSVAIHATTTALLFLLVLRCFAGQVGLAAFAALLFGVHPMRLESVAWLAERKDVLALFFSVGTLHAWVGYARRPSVARYLAVVPCFLLGLLAKPTVVTLPALLLLFDWWPLRRAATPAALLREKAPFAALAGVWVAVTALTQNAEGAMGAPTFTLADRVTTASLAYLAYLGKFFWPAGLGIFYPLVRHPPGVGVGAVLALVALSWLCLSRRRERPELAFAWAWFLIAPLPVIGLVQFGGQAFADRWSYLPHLGLALGGAAFAWRHLPRRLFHAGALGSLAALAIVTAVNLPYWATSETIFRHTLDVSPDNFMAHTNLGNALDADNRLDEAAPHYEEAARLNPTYPEALNNLGTLRARRGQMDAAAEQFRRALAIRPDLPLARYNLGLALSQLDQPVAAAVEWMRVLDGDPRDERTRPSLGFLVPRVLAPRCALGPWPVPPDTSAAFAAALDAWRPIPQDAALRDDLSRVRACLTPAAP